MPPKMVPNFQTINEYNTCIVINASILSAKFSGVQQVESAPYDKRRQAHGLLNLILTSNFFNNL